MNQMPLNGIVRTFSEIAQEIKKTWTPIGPAARPYHDAMMQLNTSDGNSSYYSEKARDVVNYFLANAAGWKGDDARRIKAELNRMIK